MSFKISDELVDRFCEMCGVKFQCHRDSSVNLCYNCYQNATRKIRTKSDTVIFILKILGAVLLMVWAFFRYTTTKGKKSETAGVIEAVASAGAAVLLGRNAIQKYGKTRGKNL